MSDTRACGGGFNGVAVCQRRGRQLGRAHNVDEGSEGEPSVHSNDTASNHRTFAFLSATAGILFLIVAVFGRDWDWRGVMSFVTGIVYLLISAQQLRKVSRRQ